MSNASNSPTVEVCDVKESPSDAKDDAIENGGEDPDRTVRVTRVKAASEQAYDASYRDGWSEANSNLSVRAEGDGTATVLVFGTSLSCPLKDRYQELVALMGDVEFLLESPKFFEMKYDPGSFSDDVCLWMQSEFEPIFNCCAKRKILTVERVDGDHLSIHLDKPDTPTAQDDLADDDDQ